MIEPLNTHEQVKISKGATFKFEISRSENSSSFRPEHSQLFRASAVKRLPHPSFHLKKSIEKTIIYCDNFTIHMKQL